MPQRGGGVEPDRTGLESQFWCLPCATGVALNFLAPSQRAEMVIGALPACQGEEGLRAVAHPSAWNVVGYKTDSITHLCHSGKI